MLLSRTTAALACLVLALRLDPHDNTPPTRRSSSRASGNNSSGPTMKEEYVDTVEIDPDVFNKHVAKWGCKPCVWTTIGPAGVALREQASNHGKPRACHAPANGAILPISPETSRRGHGAENCHTRRRHFSHQKQRARLEPAPGASRTRPTCPLARAPRAPVPPARDACACARHIKSEGPLLATQRKRPFRSSIPSGRHFEDHNLLPANAVRAPRACATRPRENAASMCRPPVRARRPPHALRASGRCTLTNLRWQNVSPPSRP